MAEVVGGKLGAGAHTLLGEDSMENTAVSSHTGPVDMVDKATASRFGALDKAASHTDEESWAAPRLAAGNCKKALMADKSPHRCWSWECGPEEAMTMATGCCDTGSARCSAHKPRRCRR